MIEFWIFIALSAMVLYGVAQVIGKVAIDSLAAPTMVAMNFFVSMPIYLIFFGMFIASIGSFTVDSVYILFGLIAALLGRAGYYTYLEALERGPVTIVGSITAAYPAIVTVLAVSVLGESISIAESIGVAIVIIGMVGISFSHGLPGEKSAFTRLSLILSVVTLALWGVWGIFVKLALHVLPVIYYLGLYAVVLPPLFGTYVRHRKLTRSQILPKWTLPVIIAAISVEVGTIALLFDTTAVSLGEAAIVFPLIASYPIVMILLAFAFLKERLSGRDIMLVLAVIAGILLLSTA